MSLPMDLLERIGALQPLPLTAERLLRTTREEPPSLDELVEIVELDEAITSNLIRVANSSAYAGFCRVGSLSDAISRIGFNCLVHLALRDCLRGLAGPGARHEITERELWLHAAISSFAAEEIALESVEPSLAQLAAVGALVHDVGKLIILRYMDVDLLSIVARAHRDGVPFVVAERRAMGFDHAEVGAAMAEKWSFPSEIIEAVGSHHRIPNDRPTPVADMVSLANMVAKTVAPALGVEGMNLVVDLRTPTRLGLTCRGFDRIYAGTRKRLHRLRRLYGFAPPGEEDDFAITGSLREGQGEEH